MKATLFITLLFCLALSARAQSIISGTVRDSGGEAVAFANAILFNAVDSQMVKAEITDMDGLFNLTGLSRGTYRLKVSFVGYAPFESGEFTLGDNAVKTFDSILLQPDENVLEAVEITTERALIEVQPDKTVFNVEGSVNATGNTALELLRKAPGVMVDNDDNIILLGKSGTKIYIDGKPSPLGGEDLAILLRSMQSSEIDAIEIITNPSSKYDAEGDAGIINIRLKKDKNLGANANINLGYNQGFYAKYNGTVNMNYRNKSVNLFGMYSLNSGTWRSTMDFDSYMDAFNTFTNSMNKYSGNYNSFKLGADFFIDKMSTIGFIADGSLYNWSNYSNSISQIFDANTNMPLSDLVAGSEALGDNVNLHANINYRFDNLEGNTWSIDGDFGKYDNLSNSYQPNTYYDPIADTTMDVNIYTSEAPTSILLYTANVDHERKLGNGKLGAGIKFSYVTTDNTYDFFELINGIEVLDASRSNHFVYEENINAAYINYAFAIDKVNITLGLRAEQTNNTGTLTSLQETEDNTVSRSYLDLFPSGGIAFNINQKTHCG